jgi:hypothetical protein
MNTVTITQVTSVRSKPRMQEVSPPVYSYSRNKYSISNRTDRLIAKHVITKISMPEKKIINTWRPAWE